MALPDDAAAAGLSPHEYEQASLALQMTGLTRAEAHTQLVEQFRAPVRVSRVVRVPSFRYGPGLLLAALRGETVELSVEDAERGDVTGELAECAA